MSDTPECTICSHTMNVYDKHLCFAWSVCPECDHSAHTLLLRYGEKPSHKGFRDPDYGYVSGDIIREMLLLKQLGESVGSENCLPAYTHAMRQLLEDYEEDCIDRLPPLVAIDRNFVMSMGRHFRLVSQATSLKRSGLALPVYLWANCIAGYKVFWDPGVYCNGPADLDYNLWMHDNYAKCTQGELTYPPNTFKDDMEVVVTHNTLTYMKLCYWYYCQQSQSSKAFPKPVLPLLLRRKALSWWLQYTWKPSRITLLSPKLVKPLLSSISQESPLHCNALRVMPQGESPDPVQYAANRNAFEAVLSEKGTEILC